MSLRIILMIAGALLFSLVPAAQEDKNTNTCIAIGQPIYTPGVDGVNPPQPPPPDKNAKDAPKIRGAMSLELIVNSEGNVCSVKILGATDKNSAQQIAGYISQHWSFRPATKKGKPVAVKFTMNFQPS